MLRASNSFRPSPIVLGSGGRRNQEDISMGRYRTDPERREVRMLLTQTPLRGARVLEIGCGDGRLTRRIAAAARSVVGIDSDASAIARAQRLRSPRHRGRIRFEVGRGEELQFRDRTVDLVLFSWSL
jgi:ubiquinone/menaquinone biosynthesis C-methylase UbiE